MTVITRFAPSPTGFLHVGNIRMAFMNYLLSKKFNGKFILRIDDTDLERSKHEYEETIKSDLEWLHLNYDSTFNQSSNIEIYNEYLDKLKDQDLVYPCYETREELEYKRKLQLEKGMPPIYDRSALKLNDKQKKYFENQGKKPYYRFKVLHQNISWNDLIKGPITIHGSNLSDPIIVKENGIFLYSFSSVVDDIKSNISHIIRGEDHLSNTALQIQLFNCLGFSPPVFGHMSLLSLLQGGELSKRVVSNNNIQELKKQGIHRLAILNYLFMLGQSDQKHLYMSLADMVQVFDLAKYSTSAVKFDSNKLLQINSLILQNLNFEDIKDDLYNLNLINVTKELWDLCKHNILNMCDLQKYSNILYGDISYTTNNASVIQVAINNLPSEEFTPNIVEVWINNIFDKVNITRKELFKILRMSLTGEISGPNFKDLVIVMGCKKVKERLLKSL